MTIKSYKVDEGTLTFGATETAKDFTAQVTECAVDWEEEVEDSVPTLSGEELEGDATYTATLSGTFVQDIEDNGLADWTWDNKGTVQPFTYVPSGLAGRAITGNVRVRPIKVGGAVKSRPTADFEWRCIGEPLLGADLS